jgi:hypothetical protein
MAGITAAVSLLGIPIYFYGKMTRLALLKWAPMRLAYEERPESNTGPLIPFLATCKENGSAGKSIILVHVLMEFLFCLLRFRTAFTIFKRSNPLQWWRQKSPQTSCWARLLPGNA